MAGTQAQAPCSLSCVWLSRHPFPCRSAIRPWVRDLHILFSFAGVDTQFYISSLKSAVYTGSKFSILTLENRSQSRTVFPGFAESWGSLELWDPGHAYFNKDWGWDIWINTHLWVVRMTGQGTCEQEPGSESIGPLSLQAVRGSVGLSVAVQCIALPWEEELCLRLMKEVETLVKNQMEPKWQDTPSPGGLSTTSSKSALNVPSFSRIPDPPHFSSSWKPTRSFLCCPSVWLLSTQISQIIPAWGAG